MPSSVQDNAQQLLKVWQENVAEIQAEEDHAYLQVDHAIDEVKKHIVSVITELK